MKIDTTDREEVVVEVIQEIEEEAGQGEEEGPDPPDPDLDIEAEAFCFFFLFKEIGQFFKNLDFSLKFS